MKNFKSNLKGFTLVELIVVMAIIGVLAAVLVPGLLGYMKDSRISAANQAAHAVHTAVSSWHAKEVAANDNAADFAGVSVVTAVIAHNAVSVGDADIDVAFPAPLDAANLDDKLGEKYYGSALVQFTAGGDAVAFCTWAASNAAAAGGAGPDGQYTSADQDEFPDNAAIVGCSPLASNV